MFNNSYQKVLHLFSLIQFESSTGKNLWAAFSEALSALNELVNMKESVIALHDNENNSYIIKSSSTDNYNTKIPCNFFIEEVENDQTISEKDFLKVSKALDLTQENHKSFPLNQLLFFPIYHGTEKLGVFCFIKPDDSEITNDIKKLINSISVLFGNLIYTHRLENQLKKTIQELKETNQQLDSFAAICAHDLREPLRTVTNYSQVLGLKNIKPTERNEIIAKISYKCKSMDSLIHSILKYSKLGHRSTLIESINILSIVEDLKKELKALLINKNAVIDIENSGTYSVQGDYLQIKQLLSNLITNAINHNNKPSPNIKITCSEKENHWTIKIKDNGPGFTHQETERVNQIFKAENSPQSFSNGMGLLIIQRIIKNHRGSILLEKPDGNGSTFTIKLNKNLQKD
ncbi:MAG: hypothetical protein CMM87_02200 [Rickettsiales bacterium]|nr:hypothetical protein [Rickettsiales bacterium]|tara:strand:- start:2836 stop:4044 length:1209 start_codon:yes stop_codon:yes gene_type:complete